MPALGPVLPCPFGRYTLVERVGAGGMATVYRARLDGEGGFEKEVAVKVVREELASDPQFRTLFLDEARLSARLAHANLVQTFDFGQVDGTWFLAMEFVRGRTLANLLRALRTRNLWPGTARSLHLAAEVATGLGHAHRLAGPDGRPLGLVHRDVSPQNVLVSAEGEVKLGDFGIAKAALSSHVTQPGKVRGKCAYMAPEQARGRAVDARADVFSLGVVLWECLTGTALFDGGSDAEILLQVLQKQVVPPSRVRAEVPPEVDAAVLRMLDKDPAARPANGDAAALELAALKFRLARSPTDWDLKELERALRSGTAVQLPAAPRSVEVPIELTVAAPEAPPPTPVENAREAAERPASTAAPGAASRSAAPAGVSTGTTAASSAPTERTAASSAATERTAARSAATESAATGTTAGGSTGVESGRPRAGRPGPWRALGLVVLSVAVGALLGFVALRNLPLRPPSAGAEAPSPAVPATSPAAAVSPPAPGGASPAAAGPPAAAAPADAPALADPPAPAGAASALAVPGGASQAARAVDAPPSSPNPPRHPAKVRSAPSPAAASATPVRVIANPVRVPASPLSAEAPPVVETTRPAPAPEPVAELVVSSLLAEEDLEVRIDGGAARRLPARRPVSLEVRPGRRRISIGRAGRPCVVMVEAAAGRTLALHQGEDGRVARLDGTRKHALACE